MRIKAKLRRIGNSQGVLLPLNVITDKKLGDEIELEVITNQDEMVENGQKMLEPTPKVITPVSVCANTLPDTKEFEFNTKMCDKHEGSMRGTCGCQ